MSMQQDVNMLLQELYDEYQEVLRRMARSLDVPDMEVDDVVQETFIAYFSKYSLTWTPNHKKAMLIRIVRRKAIDCNRKYGTHFAFSLEDDGNLHEVQWVVKFMVNDPLDIIIEDEAIRQIVIEISGMKTEWKEMAVLYFLEQHTIPEICEILNIPGTVCRSRIYRTRVYLKKVLGSKYNL